MPLGTEDLERVWSDLAEALDLVRPERRELYLCKLALLLARECDDPDRVRDALATAARSLEPPQIGEARVV